MAIWTCKEQRGLDSSCRFSYYDGTCDHLVWLMCCDHYLHQSRHQHLTTKKKLTLPISNWRVMNKFGSWYWLQIAHGYLNQSLKNCSICNLVCLIITTWRIDWPIESCSSWILILVLF